MLVMFMAQVILRHPQVALSPMEESLGSRTASIALTTAGSVRPTAASPPSLLPDLKKIHLTGQGLWLPQYGGTHEQLSGAFLRKGQILLRAGGL